MTFREDLGVDVIDFLFRQNLLDLCENLRRIYRNIQYNPGQVAKSQVSIVVIINEN